MLFESILGLVVFTSPLISPLSSFLLSPKFSLLAIYVDSTFTTFFTSEFASDFISGFDSLLTSESFKSVLVTLFVSCKFEFSVFTVFSSFLTKLSFDFSPTLTLFLASLAKFDSLLFAFEFLATTFDFEKLSLVVGLSDFLLSLDLKSFDLLSCGKSILSNTFNPTLFSILDSVAIDFLSTSPFFWFSEFDVSITSFLLSLLDSI